LFIDHTVDSYLCDIFQGAYTGVCSQSHVPSYKNNIDKLKAKGIDSVICVAVNDPYVLNGWAEKLQAKDAVSNYSVFPMAM
jgi:peroxiredoxin